MVENSQNLPSGQDLDQIFRVIFDFLAKTEWVNVIKIFRTIKMLYEGLKTLQDTTDCHVAKLFRDRSRKCDKNSDRSLKVAF